MRNYKFSKDRAAKADRRSRTSACAAALLCVCAMLAASPSGLQAQSTDLQGNTDFAYAEKLASDGYVELAIEQYKDFIARFPGDSRVAEARRRIADGYTGLKMYAEARSHYEKLLLQYPASPFAQDALYQIGVCFEQEGAVAEAARQFERFAVLNESSPRAADGFLRAGRLYLTVAERTNGRKLLFRVIENNPQQQAAVAEAHFLLIQDFVDAGEYNRAFSLVNLYLQQFAQVTATAQIWLIKAGLHETLGQISETITTLEAVQSRFAGTSEARQATFELGRLHFELGNLDKAHALLAKLEPSGSGGDSLVVEAALLHAQVFLDEQRLRDAAERVQPVLAAAGGLTAEQRVRCADVFYLAGDFQKAAEIYDAARRGIAEGNDSLRATVAFKSARAFFELGNGARAVDGLRSISPEDTPPSIEADVHLLRADIYFELYEDPARALRHYAEFVENYPEHKSVDDAQAKLALCYEALHQWNLALAEWQRLQQNFPASPFYADAQNHLELLQKYFSDNYQVAVESAVADLGQNGQPLDVQLRQAELHYRFRHFHKAIPLLKETIAADENPAVRARAMALLGNSYFALGEIAFLEKNARASALFDSAKVLLSHVRRQYADQVDDAGLAYKLSLIALQNEKTELAVLDSISRAHRHDRNFSRLHSHVLVRLLPIVVRQDSTAHADYLSRVVALSSFTDRRLENQAHLLSAQFALLRSDTAKAIAGLETIVNGSQRDPARAQAELLYAKLLAKTGRIDTAMALLDSYRFKYQYSDFADSALFYLATFSYEQGKFDRAIQYLHGLRQRRMVQAANGNFGDLWPEAAYLEARAFEQAGRHFEAIHAYLSFLQAAPADVRASRAFIALGQLAEKFRAFSLAEKYYAEVSTLYPQRIADGNLAKMKLVDLLFRLGEYQTARTLALQTLQSNLAFADEMAMTKTAIIANLRQNDAQTAESEIKNFKNKFDDDNQAYAEIQFELGDYYLRQKNFRRADKIFKDLSKKFEGTEYGIQGAFGYGKSLLYQTKTEDALETLTEIPRDYPNHPFLRVVYLNLGDFYWDQQQWGNAIQAFHQVLADSTYDQYHKAALAKLSELYQSTGMYDASLAYTRKYIELFPREDNIMLFKMRIGSLLRELKQYDEAVAYYRKLLPFAHGENAIEIQYYIGDSYFEARKYELAIAELLKLRYSKLTTKLPWRTTAVYKAGEAYLRLNHYERALEMYQFVVRSEGANSQLGNFAFRKISQIEEMLKNAPKKTTKS